MFPTKLLIQFNNLIIKSIGPFNGALEKFFTINKPHYAINIEFDIYFLYSWDNEYFNLYLDGDSYINNQIETYQKTQWQDVLCENNNQLSKYSKKGVVSRYSLTVYHNSSYLNVTISTTLNQYSWDEAYGLVLLKMTAQVVQMAKQKMEFVSLYNGECLKTCPFYTIQRGGICYDEFIQQIKDNYEILSDFMQQNISNLDVINSGWKLEPSQKDENNFYYNKLGGYQCGNNQYVLGFAYSIFQKCDQICSFQKQYNIGLKHSKIKLRLQYIQGDFWISDDYLKIYMDSVEVIKIDNSQSNDQYLHKNEQICGGPNQDSFEFYEKVYNFDFDYINHSKADLTLKFEWKNSNYSHIQWPAFREIQILAFNCFSKFCDQCKIIDGEEICTSCEGKFRNLNDNCQCLENYEQDPNDYNQINCVIKHAYKCQNNQYLDENNNCQNCFYYDDTCLQQCPGENDSYQSLENIKTELKKIDGKNICVSVDQNLYYRIGAFIFLGLAILAVIVFVLTSFYKNRQSQEQLKVKPQSQIKKQTNSFDNQVSQQQIQNSRQNLNHINKKQYKNDNQTYQKNKEQKIEKFQDDSFITEQQENNLKQSQIQNINNKIFQQNITLQQHSEFNNHQNDIELSCSNIDRQQILQ
ncbi:hypothetical protein PPERSA_04525 [Pseudocohnilembus persalinus]|uniref:Insulin-like growth factor binding protein, N-terminal n=1 Tax=Pseudocohnilembus persalinus TaxID=266149 RepID=A0A0V0QTZ5_PSEPJ|nr:hypothetical protein PPERSA_04525 [Pseudocohnilembus persalinus]|eukprot:KRX05488.1 hypothetical protein PPERSA_04525 [Pseudocohnilembus persalinus]